MAKKRKHKQKGKKRLIVSLTGISFIAGIYFSFSHIEQNFLKICSIFSNVPGFNIKNINIIGTSPKTSNLIRKNLKISENENLFKLSAEEIYNNVLRVSWVKSVVVQKNLPNVLNIKITETVPIAIFQHESKSSLIDEDGAFIENIDIKPLGLPLISGENANKNVKSILDTISNFSDISNLLESLSFIRERRWDIVVSGIKINLPEKDVEQALEVLSVILKSGKINKNTSSVIDMRIPENVIINGLKLKKEATV